MSLMQGLADWLRQIVAVVLLATLVDLLLPNKTMQRYVRLVAGLFILLTVASPVLQWVKGDFGSRLAAGLQAVELSPGGAAGELARIKEEGGKLRESRMDASAELAAAKLEEAIRGDLVQVGGQSVRSVDVDVARMPDGSLNVGKVVVSLRETADMPVTGGSPAGSSSSGPAPVAEVEPVAPVIVEIPQETADPSDVPEESGHSADRQTLLRISSFISARFGISTDRVEVRTDEPNGS